MNLGRVWLEAPSSRDVCAAQGRVNNQGYRFAIALEYQDLSGFLGILETVSAPLVAEKKRMIIVVMCEEGATIQVKEWKSFRVSHCHTSKHIYLLFP